MPSDEPGKRPTPKPAHPTAADAAAASREIAARDSGIPSTAAGARSEPRPLTSRPSDARLKVESRRLLIGAGVVIGLIVVWALVRNGGSGQNFSVDVKSRDSFGGFTATVANDTNEPAAASCEISATNDLGEVVGSDTFLVEELGPGESDTFDAKLSVSDVPDSFEGLCTESSDQSPATGRASQTYETSRQVCSAFSLEELADQAGVAEDPEAVARDHASGYNDNAQGFVDAAYEGCLAGIAEREAGGT